MRLGRARGNKARPFQEGRGEPMENKFTPVDSRPDQPTFHMFATKIDRSIYKVGILI